MAMAKLMVLHSTSLTGVAIRESSMQYSVRLRRRWKKNSSKNTWRQTREPIASVGQIYICARGTRARHTHVPTAHCSVVRRVVFSLVRLIVGPKPAGRQDIMRYSADSSSMCNAKHEPWQVLSTRIANSLRYFAIPFRIAFHELNTLCSQRCNRFDNFLCRRCKRPAVWQLRTLDPQQKFYIFFSEFKDWKLKIKDWFRMSIDSKQILIRTFKNSWLSLGQFEPLDASDATK